MSEAVDKGPVIRLAFLDVGQGDTTVITCPETSEAIVVDCIDHKAVLNYLERESIHYLRGVAITHAHADHYKGVADLLHNCSDKLGIEGCEVFAFSEGIDPGLAKKPEFTDDDKHSSMYDELPVRRKSNLAKLHHWCVEHEERCFLLRDVKNVSPAFNGVLGQHLQVLHPPLVGYPDLRRSSLNDISVILRITGNGSSALLMGDLEYYGWQNLSARHPDMTCDVLKFPHHGGTWTESQANELLSLLHPSKVVLSVGSDNTYNHPSSGVFAALYNQEDVQLFCTQATSACLAGAPVEREISAITRKYQERSLEDGSFLVQPRRGHCPCAGTVVIELGEKVRILQPDPHFHLSSVIDRHFQKHHKCRVLLPINATI